MRGGKDVSLDVQSTAHGPLLNPMFTQGDAADCAEVDALRPDAELRFRCTQIEHRVELGGVFGGADAVVAGRRRTLSTADDQGHIAYHAIGAIPLRPAGLDGRADRGWRARVAGLHSL